MLLLLPMLFRLSCPVRVGGPLGSSVRVCLSLVGHLSGAWVHFVWYLGSIISYLIKVWSTLNCWYLRSISDAFYLEAIGSLRRWSCIGYKRRTNWRKRRPMSERRRPYLNRYQFIPPFRCSFCRGSISVEVLVDPEDCRHQMIHEGWWRKLGQTPKLK